MNKGIETMEKGGLRQLIKDWVSLENEAAVLRKQMKLLNTKKKEVSDKLKPRAFEIYFKTNSDIFTVCSRLDKSRVFQEHGIILMNVKVFCIRIIGHLVLLKKL